MSVVPSLIMWSSIKAPLAFNSSRSRGDAAIADSSGEPRRNKRSESSARTMVNLRVPKPVGKGKENSCPCLTCDLYLHSHRGGRPPSAKGLRSPGNPFQSHPNILSKSPDELQRKPPKKINFVTIPEITSDKEIEDLFQSARRSFLFDSRTSAWSQDTEEDLNEPHGEYSLESLERGDSEEESIPSVKRCTLEELREINRRYSLLEENIRRAAAEKKKRKRRGPNLDFRRGAAHFVSFQNADSSSKLQLPDTARKSLPENNPKKDGDDDSNDVYFDCECGHSELDGDAGNYCAVEKVIQPKVIKADQSYYESKLLKLYMIELGISL